MVFALRDPRLREDYMDDEDTNEPSALCGVLTELRDMAKVLAVREDEPAPTLARSSEGEACQSSAAPQPGTLEACHTPAEMQASHSSTAPKPTPASEVEVLRAPERRPPTAEAEACQSSADKPAPPANATDGASEPKQSAAAVASPCRRAIAE